MYFTKKNFFKYTLLFSTFGIANLYIYILAKKNSSNKINIIFDLDETIIHSEKTQILNNWNKSNIIESDLEIGLGFEVEEKTRTIWIRPGVKLLLPIISEFNDVYLFTKAKKIYADEILSKTNLDKYFIEKKYRDDCFNTCKDLTKFNLDMNLNKSILIDDKLSNSCDGQIIYHIPRFNSYTRYDFEFFKLFGFILILNIKKDLNLI